MAKKKCPTSMMLENETRKQLVEIIRESPTPRNNTAAVRGLVSKMVNLLRFQIGVEAAGGEVMLQPVNLPEEDAGKYPARVLDVRL